MISNSQKGEITSILLSRVLVKEPQLQDFEVEIIDGFYHFHTVRDSPIKYGQFASFLLKRLCDTRAFEVHIIFDKDEYPSIKDLDTRKKVYENPSQYEIKGPNQERNGALSKCLSNANFRDELVQFLINHWAENDESASILGDKRVFLSYGQQCYLYSKNFVKKKIVKSFENNHIELESKIILHLQKIVAKRILVKISSSETLMVYPLYHMQFWPIGREIWIETGDVQKNTMQLINVTQIFRLCDHVFVNALPAWYVFSACLYEPSFYGKGRKSCLKTLEKNSQFQISFGNIGN